MRQVSFHPVFARPSLGRFLDRVVTGSFPDARELDVDRTVYPVNVAEFNDRYEVTMAAPGCRKEDFSISVHQHELTIQVSRSDQHENKEGEKWVRREFSVHSSTRRFQLDDTVEGDAIEARYSDGILFVTLPKKSETKSKDLRLIDIR